ncbi:MAG: M14 family zinc carboxypeptidase [Candidatus Colwellbacteria bacterium]|nr:M14 family zinc carboxypeptidase [Candidatus Colwellbacteria bacterium]
MQFLLKSRAVAAILALAALGVCVFVFFILSREARGPSPIEQEKVFPIYEVIGKSVEGRPIVAYTYGDGATHLLFIGGIHGGYEWNSVLLSYQLMDYLEAYPAIVPEDLTVSVIPSANPDGVFEVIGAEGRFTAVDVQAKTGAVGTGRLNAHGVDLNRNFDCKWRPESMWRGNVVDAGLAPFSEPEARAIRDFVLENDSVAVVFWHSQSNAVYASECENGILAGTRAAMNAYTKASGYPAVDSFDAYEITGDAEGWLASIGIPAITVELSTHETTEWERNLAGAKALFSLYSGSN